jgi:Asp-tRNA(Asn)/Glu-tRNA(Gln) amidotransferase B subunit
LKKFFNFIGFELTDQGIEYRCNKFVEKAKDNANWTLSQIIRFLQYQKKRVEHKEITAGTLKNFVNECIIK